jgi:hypothetical protein
MVAGALDMREDPPGNCEWWRVLVLGLGRLGPPDNGTRSAAAGEAREGSNRGQMDPSSATDNSLGGDPGITIVSTDYLSNLDGRFRQFSGPICLAGLR